MRQSDVNLFSSFQYLIVALAQATRRMFESDAVMFV